MKIKKRVLTGQIAVMMIISFAACREGKKGTFEVQLDDGYINWLS